MKMLNNQRVHLLFRYACLGSLLILTGPCAIAELTAQQISSAVSSKTVLGFWDFRDGVPGERVEAVSNIVVNPLINVISELTFNDGDRTGYAEEDFPRPSFSARAPHVRDPRAADPSAFIPLQSVRFYNDPTNAAGYNTGFSLRLKGLSTALQELGSFTVEFYTAWEWPELIVGKGNLWRTAALLYWNNGSSARCYGASSEDTFGWYVADASACSGTRNVGVNAAWSHVALVCDNGALKTYVDHVQVGSAVFTPAEPDGVIRDLILGSNNGGTIFVGTIAGLRVTAGALEPSEFLQDVSYPEQAGKPQLFYDFKDGAVGCGVTNVCNKVDGNVTARVVNKCLTFSDDVPGRRLTAGGVTICDSLQSVDCGLTGGGLLIDDLGRLISSCDAFTFESFFKVREDAVISGNPWLSFMGINEGTTPVRKIRAGFDNVTAIRLRTWCPADSYTSVTPTYGTTFLDGKWHHYALTYDKNRAPGQELDIRVDYEVKVAKAWTNILQTARRASGICLTEEGGANALPVLISGVRFTPVALVGDQLLRATESPTNDAPVLWWRFEEPAGAAVGYAESFDADIARRGWGTKHGGSGTKPTYAAVTGKKRLRTGGQGDVVNESCAEFYGQNAAAGRNSWAQSCVESTRVQSPETSLFTQDFTMELFMNCATSRVELTENNGQMTFVHVGGVNQPDVRSLQLELQNGSGCLIFSYRDGANLLCQNSATGYADERWHHVAVTHDSVNRKLCLYMDYVLVYDVTLSSGLTIADGARIMLGSNGYGAAGFVGYLDEFRVSNGVLAPSQFLRRTTGKGLVLIVR